MSIPGLIAAVLFALVYMGYVGWRKEGKAQWEMIQQSIEEEKQKKREEEIYNRGFRGGYLDRDAEED